MNNFACDVNYSSRFWMKFCMHIADKKVNPSQIRMSYFRKKLNVSFRKKTNNKSWITRLSKISGHNANITNAPFHKFQCWNIHIIEIKLCLFVLDCRHFQNVSHFNRPSYQINFYMKISNSLNSFFRVTLLRPWSIFLGGTD